MITAAILLGWLAWLCTSVIAMPDRSLTFEEKWTIPAGFVAALGAAAIAIIAVNS